MKVCSKCGAEKPLSDYHKLRTSLDGHRPDCKVCAKEQREKRFTSDPLKHSIHNLAHGIFSRTTWKAKDKYKNQSYRNNQVENRLGDTPEEVRSVLESHFKEDILKLLEQGLTPSVDRIDSDGHYELGNIQIIPFKDNILKGAIKGGAAIAKAVIASGPNDEQLEFESVSAAARHFGCKRDTILSSIKVNLPTRKGWLFNYK